MREGNYDMIFSDAADIKREPYRYNSVPVLPRKRGGNTVDFLCSAYLRVYSAQHQTSSNLMRSICPEIWQGIGRSVFH